MAITAQSLIDKARLILQETSPGGMRWKDPELLGWLNEAQVEIVKIKPNVSSTNTNIQLAQGTLQTIPDNGVSLIKIVRNMQSAANTGNDLPGRSIRITDIEILDAENPDWHTQSADTEVLYYTFDEDDPKHFYVYPPQPASPGYINLVYSSAPVEVATLADNITIRDIYSNQIIDYILFRCYQKDASYAGNQQRSMTHFNLFMQLLTGKKGVEMQITPNVDQEISRAN
jgi:hypothetical protein